MARSYTDSLAGGLALGGVGAAAAEPPAVRVRAEPPATAHPPRGAQAFAVTLAGAAPPPPTARPTPKLAAFADDFTTGSITANPKWATPLDYLLGPKTTLAEDPTRNALVWAGYYDTAPWGASRGTAAPVDATAALVTFDVLTFKPNISNGVPDRDPTQENGGEPSALSVWLEDRAANQRLRFRLTRLPYSGYPNPYDRAYRLEILTERSEGAPVVVAKAYALNPISSETPVRRVRCGYNGDGTLRMEVLRTDAGLPEAWEGLTAVPVPEDFAAAFNPAAVYLHLEYRSGSLQANLAEIANLRGSLPVGPTPPAPRLTVVAVPMAGPAGGPNASPGLTVPDDFCAVVDEVVVSMLTLAAVALDPAARRPGVADLWVRVLVDGVPQPGVNEIRPTALLLGPDAGAPGLVFSRTLRPRLTVRSGQRLSAELMVRDAAAGHPVECTLTGWLYPADLNL